MKAPKLYKPKRTKAPKFDNPQRKKHIYDKAWQRYRFRFLHQNPRCYACGEKSSIVDHIVPHKNEQNAFEMLTNHLPLCKSCHDYCTGEFDRFTAPKTEEKAHWLKTKREMTGTTVKVKILGSYKG